MSQQRAQGSCGQPGVALALGALGAVLWVLITYTFFVAVVVGSSKASDCVATAASSQPPKPASGQCTTRFPPSIVCSTVIAPFQLLE